MMKQRNSLPNTALEGAITSEDVLGKDVIDKDGFVIGVTSKIYIDPQSMAVIGVMIDKGFLRSGLVVGADLISDITDHAVFLSFRPAFRLTGMHVFDCDGELVGVVRFVSLDSTQTKVISLEVRRPGLLGKTLLISGSAVSLIEDNVLLHLSLSDLI